MVDENGERVSPDEFIPVAERYNLMSFIDRWVFRRALQLSPAMITVNMPRSTNGASIYPA